MRGRTRDRAAHRPRFEGLEGRQLMVASLAPIPNVLSPQDLGYQVPLEGGSGAAQTYTVTSTNPAIRANVATGKFLTVNVSHASAGANDPAFTGALTFQLFGELTPVTTARIEQLVRQGFYSGKIFHRVAPNFPGPADFIVQGGSVSGNGTGSVNQPGFPFPDEFVQQLAFTNAGQLAMANAGDDTNDSQFFVTTGAPDFLTFNHTIFGQLVSGFDTLARMTQVARNGTTPATPITITSASLADTSPDGVIHIDTTDAVAGQTGTVVVTAREPATGTSTQQSFQVTVVPAPSNTRAYLANIPQSVTVGANQPAIIALPGVGAEAGDRLTYVVAGGVVGGQFTPVQNATATIDQSTGVLTVTPRAGFTGTIPLVVGVRDQVDRSGGLGPETPTNYDTQALSLTVTAGAPVNLQPIALPTTATVPADDLGTIQLRGLTANPNSAQTLTYSLVAPPTNGTVVSLDAQTGVLTYRPNPGFAGTDTLRFQVRDVGAPEPNFTSVPATVTLNVTPGAPRNNHPPIALPGNTAVTVGTPATVQLSGSTGDPGTAQTLVYSLVDQPDNGQVTGFDPARGTFTYTPNPGFVGVDTVTFRVRDVGEPTPNLSSDVAVHTLTVTAVPTTNNPPTAAPATITAAPGVPTPVQLVGTTGDPATAQTLLYSIVVPPANGTITGFNPQTGSLVYTPKPGYTGTDAFQFRTRDVGAPEPNLDSPVVTVTVNVRELTGETRSVRVIGNVLVVTPPPGTGPNTIVVDQAEGNLRVRVNGLLDVQQPAATDIDRLVVYGTKASDRIAVDPSVTIPATLSGGLGGRNVLQAGGGPTREHGWFGRNTLAGGPEDDALIGRAGRVRFVPSGGNDTLFLADVGTPPNGTYYRSVNGRIVPRSEGGHRAPTTLPRRRTGTPHPTLTPARPGRLLPNRPQAPGNPTPGA